MIAQLQTSVPGQLTAGDTAEWRRSFTDYFASDGWALAYTFISTGAVYNFTGATADGDTFVVSIPAATTASWTPGRYSVQEFVTKSAARHTLGITQLIILPNMAAASVGFDMRSHARKTLDNIEAWIETKAPTAASFEIAGRKLQNYPLLELLKLRDRYRFEVNNEITAANGGSRGSRILTRL